MISMPSIAECRDGVVVTDNVLFEFLVEVDAACGWMRAETSPQNGGIG